MKTLKLGLFALLILSFLSVPAWANRCMRHDGQRICPGDSIYAAVSAFGDPLYKDEIGNKLGQGKECKAYIWVYEIGRWRYELKVIAGVVRQIDRMRIHRRR